MLPFPIPSGFHIVPSTKDICNTLCFVKALEQSRFSRDDANVDLRDQLFPCCLGVHDEIIPNKVFNLRLVPFFMIEHLVIVLNSCSP